ncbi:MAG: bifunctional riboflavin kinase/FAD synthetase [Pseudomonadota bacterium]
MRILRHLNEIGPEDRGAVVALGNFDGFHRGHQIVVGLAARKASEIKAPLAIFTTEPHPRQIFQPNGRPFRLTPEAARINQFKQFGVDILYQLSFTPELYTLTATHFVERILCTGFGVRHVVAGYDYCFGKDRGGNVNTLREWGEKAGFGVTVVEPVGVGVEGSAGEVYSSTLIRNALRQGEARRAAALLGHWWMVEGPVIKGDQRGRTIEFPTANLSLEEYLVPLHGVYAVRVTVDEHTFDGVANIGRRPTFDKDDVLLEAHLFDFADDLYGKSIRVELVAFIREEKKFAGLEELKTQIARDCETARLLLNDPENASSRYPTPHRSTHQSKA